MTEEEFNAKYGYKDGKPLKGKEYIEWKKGNGVPSIQSSPVKKANYHAGLNILKTNTKLIYATIFDKEAKETNGRIFFYIPGLMQIQDENEINTREQTFDLPARNYTTKDNRHIFIDFVVKYKIVSAVKSYESSQNVQLAISQDIKTVIDLFVGQHIANYFESKRQIDINDLDKVKIQTIEEKYGIKITSINSNDLMDQLQNKVEEERIQTDAQREIERKNTEQEIALNEQRAKSQLKIAEDQLQIDKQRLEMFKEALSNTKAPNALARMYSASTHNDTTQDIEIHHPNQVKVTKRK